MCTVRTRTSKIMKMKVSYEGRTHLRKRGWKKPYGPTTKAYSPARVKTSKQFVSKLVI